MVTDKADVAVESQGSSIVSKKIGNLKSSFSEVIGVLRKRK